MAFAIISTTLPTRCQVAAAEGGPPSTVAPAPVSVESVQSSQNAIAQDSRLDAETKAALLAAYTNAISWARIANEKTKIAAEFASARQAAPALVLKLSSDATNVSAEVSSAISTNTPLKALESELAATEAESSTTTASLATLRDEPKRRAARRIELANTIAATKARLDETKTKPEPPTEPALSPEMSAATAAMNAARTQALTAELNAAEEELRYYDVSADLLTAQTDQAGRLVSLVSTRIEALRQAIAQRRRMEAQAAVDAAEQQRQNVPPTTPALPLIASLARENAEIAAQRTGTNSVAGRIETASASLEKIRAETRNLEETFGSIERRVQALERSRRSIDDSTGLLLRRARANLPDVGRLRTRNAATQAELSAAQLAAFDLQDQRVRLNDPAGRAKLLVNAPESGISAARRPEAEAVAAQLLQARRGYLDGLLGDYETYLRTLIDLDAAQRSLMLSSSRIGKYIDERVLWIRSAPSYSLSEFQTRIETFKQRFPAAGWADLGKALRDDLRQNPPLMALVATVFIGLMILKRRIGKALDVFGGEAGQTRISSFRPTLSAAFGTLAISAIIPLLLSFLAWRLLAVSEESAYGGFIRSVSDGLFAVSLAFLTLEYYRQLCRPHGLAEAHFGWSKHNTRLAGFHLRWLIVALLPLTFFVAAIEGRDQVASFGQFFFILAMLCLAVFAHCLLRPATGLRLFATDNISGRRLTRLAHLVSVTVPLALGLAAWFGYYYTTLELSWRFEATVWLILSVLLIHALVLRWFFLARRRWAIEQAKKKRAAQEEAKLSGGGDGSDESPPLEPDITLSALDLQTRSLIRFSVGLLLVLGLWGIWSGIFPALNAFKRVELWQLESNAAATTPLAATGAVGIAETTAIAPAPGVEIAVSQATHPVRMAVTLADLFWVLIIIAVSFAAIRNIPALLELTVLNRLQLQPGIGNAITTVARYVIALVGVIAGFGLLGVTWSKVQWLAAAITVGIGFGLQEIFANFISGLIILFERPIRIGDIVTVGDISGNVTRINIRATTITDFDRREFIVPNKEFVTGKLLNWTLTDPVTRVLVTVGIAYGSDVALAEKLLLKVADESPYVMKDPAPRAIFWGFGDNSLEFRLYVHIPKRNIYLEMLHGLTTGIDREFRQAGINIAFPQRDVHLHTAGPLEVQLARERQPSTGTPEHKKPGEAK